MLKFSQNKPGWKGEKTMPESSYLKPSVRSCPLRGGCIQQQEWKDVGQRAAGTEKAMAVKHVDQVTSEKAPWKEVGQRAARTEKASTNLWIRTLKYRNLLHFVRTVTEAEGKGADAMEWIRGATLAGGSAATLPVDHQASFKSQRFSLVKERLGGAQTVAFESKGVGSIPDEQPRNEAGVSPKGGSHVHSIEVNNTGMAQLRHDS
ncbi:hypothetical protein PoB_007175300 [Plakobranchus ocellatus]|uniref:Uncharacterized protein n=1 Tax=Plakobranchus ocellatus TaxID=259542 RepID=A0AAV4DMF2_9GAST|nr:hypothetical protein PoB_007175300 [Plakobranchus ocellatus]